MKTRKERRIAKSYSITTNLSNRLKSYCKDNHINHSKLIQKLVENHLNSNNEKLYNQTQLIEFGNYLLSDERKERFIIISNIMQNSVYDADISNFFDSH